MSRQINRETIKVDEAFAKPQILTWPKGAEIRHIDYKTWSNIDFWIEVDSDVDEFESRAFQVYATGQEIPADAMYLTTSVQRESDNMGFSTTAVWHVYEHKIHV